MSDIKIVKTNSFAADTTVTAEVLNNTPDGVLLIFSGTTAFTTIRPTSCSFTATVSAAPVVITDNGNGVLAGTNVTGTINYYSGAWALTFTGTAPDNTTDILGDYDYAAVGPYQVTNYDTTVSAAANVTKYRGQLPENNIIPGSVTIKIKFDGVTENYVDNFRGRLSGKNLISGYINYSDGSFILLFYFVPDTSPAQTILATYKHRDTNANEHLIKNSSEFFNRLSITNTTGGTIEVALIDSEDGYTYSIDQGYAIANNATEVRTVNSARNIRIISFGNSGFFCEFFNE